MSASLIDPDIHGVADGQSDGKSPCDETYHERDSSSSPCPDVSFTKYKPRELNGPSILDFDSEHPFQYEKGGLHPVHLNDTFKEGRYKVVHKLGHGGSSTVWMAWDTQSRSYVALKIHREDHSHRDVTKMYYYLKERVSNHPGRKYVISLLDQFHIQGPNGSHLCVVTEVAGPSLASFRDKRRLRNGAARKIGQQITQGLAYLHSEKVVHGGNILHALNNRILTDVEIDLTPGNLALELFDPDHDSAEDLKARLELPCVCDIKDFDWNYGGKYGTWPAMPQYVVQSATLSVMGLENLTGNIRIIDLGEAFHESESPQWLGTPNMYRAPELFFEDAAGKAADLWALACTLYFTRGGTDIFYSLIQGDEAVIHHMRIALGPPPDKWSRLCLDRETGEARLAESEEDKAFWIIEEANARETLEFLARWINDEYHGPRRWEDEEIVRRSEKEDEEQFRRLGYRSIYPAYKPMSPISAEEAACFFDLLSKFLRFEPEERLSAEELVDHPWFTTIFLEEGPRYGAPPLFQS